MKKSSFVLVLIFSLFFRSYNLLAQQTDSLLNNATLPNVVQYALKRQPGVQQALIDEQITEMQIKSKLSEWYPQVNVNYLYQHYFQLQSSVIGGNVVRFGVNNTSAIQFTGSQNIFNRDVLLASRTKNDVRQLTRGQTENEKIDVVVNVSKAFYDVIIADQQRKVARKNTVRLERSLKDATSRYEAGIVDKTDYKRATIALNNSRALRKTNEEALKAKTAYLKTLINYPDTSALQIVYDSAALEKDIYIDTLQLPDYSRRIEYQILQTQRKLREADLKYNKWSYIPSLTANGAYNLNYQSNGFSKLYNMSFPNSYAGLTLSFPIFQGGKRKYNIKESEWQLKRIDLDIINLKNSLSAEYVNALSSYKASLATFLAVKENVDLAQEVYDVIELQYQSGIKAYLEVVTAEADLRTAQISYFNALYQVLSSKIDMQRSLGIISPAAL